MESNMLNADYIYTADNKRAVSKIAENNFQSWQKKLESAKWWVSHQSKNSKFINEGLNTALGEKTGVDFKAKGKPVESHSEKKYRLVSFSNETNKNIKGVGVVEGSDKQQVLGKQELLNRYSVEKLLSEFTGYKVNKRSVVYSSENKAIYSAFTFEGKNYEGLRVYSFVEGDDIFINIVGNEDVSGFIQDIFEHVSFFNQQNKKNIISIKINGELIYENSAANFVMSDEFTKNKLDKIY